LINWKQAAKAYRYECNEWPKTHAEIVDIHLAIQAELTEENARLRAALAHLEGRAKDYPILFVLLDEARKQ
jgi:hypothetical protein